MKARRCPLGDQSGRDKLVAILWPESTAERAHHSLADTVYVVNHALEGAPVVSRVIPVPSELHDIDVVIPQTVLPLKRDLLSGRRPIRKFIRARAVRQLRHPAAIRVHDEDVSIPVTVGVKCDLLPIE
jgi:hypothetical protein